jgi:DNA-binding MarR family transcriptional regulator
MAKKGSKAAPIQVPDGCARAWQALRLTHNRIAGQLEANLAATCQLSLTEFDTLVALRLRGELPTRLTDLLPEVGLSQPALSRLLTRLDSRHLIERTAEAGDGRTAILTLTSEGIALVEHAKSVQSDTIASLLDTHLSGKNQAKLIDILAKVPTG